MSQLGPDGSGMLPEHSRTLLGHFWETYVVAKNDDSFSQTLFAKITPNRTHSGLVKSPICYACSWNIDAGPKGSYYVVRVCSDPIATRPDQLKTKHPPVVADVRLEKGT